MDHNFSNTHESSATFLLSQFRGQWSRLSIIRPYEYLQTLTNLSMLITGMSCGSEFIVNPNSESLWPVEWTRQGEQPEKCGDIRIV